MHIKEYPFLKGGNPVPKDKEEEVKSVRHWLQHQAHLPTISDQHILLFLHSNYYKVEKTKNTINSYFTVRAENPELFWNWDVNQLRQAYEDYEMVELPRSTPEGYRILLYRTKETDPSKFIFADGLRAFFSFNDTRVSEDGLVEGYFVVMDMKGVSLGHLTRATAGFNLIRIFMQYIQECHPVRLKGVHVINTVPLVDKILTLIKPLMQSDLIQLLHLHSDLDTLKEYMPLELLPEDYGGDAKPVALLHDEQHKLIYESYANWIKESGELMADLKKKPKKNGSDEIMMQGSFKTLSID